MIPALGAELTVTFAVAVDDPQLLETVYVIVALPIVPPVTTPALLTEAMAALELDHVPPLTASDKEVVKPGHTDVVPVMLPALGNAFTVSVYVVVAVPQAVVTP